MFRKSPPPRFEKDKVNSEGSRVIAVSFAPQTKTTLDGLQPRFEDGKDTVLISNTNALDTCVVSVKDNKATISTNLTGPLTAVYPYKAAKMSEGNQNEIDTVLVSTVQSGKFADANICMAKMKDGKDESLSFENKTAVFCIYPPTDNPEHVEVSAKNSNIANNVLTGSEFKNYDKIHVSTTTADSVYVSILVPSGLKVSDLSFSDGTNEKTVTGDKASTNIEAGTLYTVTNENWESTEADIPDGALKGVFSVSADKQVYFSQGNLYAKKDNNGMWNWGFYAKQYQYNSLSTSNPRTAQNTDTEIDLFTWGYSESTSLSPTRTGYVTGHPNDGDKLDYEKVSSAGGDDWGVAYCESNNITVGTWRTLTTAEWQYLFNRGSYTSEVRNGKYKYGVTVCGKANCVVLLPDGWKWEGDVGTEWQTEYPETQTNNEVTWQKMEDAGAVCLPAAGHRDSSTVTNFGDDGRYWSSTAGDEGRAYNARILSRGVNPDSRDYRYFGYSVRLVTDVSAAPTPTPVPLPTPSFSALSGVFTVGAGATSGPDDDVRIHFSQGNLQAFYDGEKYIWTFAANQYDYIGNTSGNRTIDSPAYGDGIDLFGWSTDAASSNWGIHTQTSTQDPDIYTGGNFKDWSGIPDIPGSWRTLSGGNGGEWQYLLEKRGSSTVSGTEDARFLKCKVNDGAREVCGLLLFPDVFTWPSGIDEPNSANINKKELKWTDVAIPVYNTGQFEKLESAGVVFIPAAGGRHGSGVHYAGSSGSYWTSSVSGGSNFANNLFFNTLLILSHNADVRYYGYSVRLVTGVN